MFYHRQESTDTLEPHPLEHDRQQLIGTIDKCTHILNALLSQKFLCFFALPLLIIFFDVLDSLVDLGDNVVFLLPVAFLCAIGLSCVDNIAGFC